MKINKVAFGLLVMGAAQFAMATESQSTTTTETSESSSTNFPTMKTTEQNTIPKTAAVTPEDLAKRADHSVISFEKGSAKLTNTAREDLRNLIEHAKVNGPVKQIQVGVWSDKEFPIRTNADLPKADRQLAEQRGDAIKKYLKDDLKISDVTIHNMAKAPGALARAFNTEDAELKSLFARKSHETTAVMPENKEIAQELVYFRDDGKPSSAVVVVDHKSK